MQKVIPLKTEHYGATRNPPEKQAPVCTLHSFPHNIDHCLTWARSEFEGSLETQPKGASLRWLLSGCRCSVRLHSSVLHFHFRAPIMVELVTGGNVITAVCLTACSRLQKPTHT